MKPILQKNYKLAGKYDVEVSHMIWEALKEAIRSSNIEIASENRDEMFLKIPGEDKADIELYRLDGFQDTGYVKINLWYYKFVNFRSDRFTSRGVTHGEGVGNIPVSYTAQSVSGALRNISRIMEEIKIDQSLKREGII